VSATSKGRGFTGVMRRHRIKGSKNATHGTHEYQRHGGSIGQRKTPGRTFRGMRMPGQFGNAATTILNLRVARVLAEEGLILVEGGVPGPKNGVVEVRGAVKAKAQA
jgi:large subunit ribosomal protein L3